MANTEGLPDEFVESLMTTPTDTISSRTSSNKTKRRGKPISSRIQERLNMPLDGGKPAARVIRASPQKDTITDKEEPQDESYQPEDRTYTPSPLLVGDIVERSAANSYHLRNNQNTGSNKKKASRFAMQQKQNDGFPSVNLPLGTFIKPRSVTRPKPTVTNSKTMALPPTREGKSQKEPSLKQASERDAQNMLAQMSPEEIKQHQKDLEAALSPEMKAFLKSRKKITTPTPTKINIQPTTRQISNATIPKKDTQQEKKRLAEIVSSIRTPQDLDAAYRAEMKQAHPLEQQNDIDDVEETGGKKANSDFQLACDLLRSTAARQTLWAARLVSQVLTERAQKRHSGGVTQEKDWSILLPISLRCLLDEPVVGQGLLHTYVLQALYSLLLLNARDEHLMWLNDKAMETDTYIHQDCFLEDFVPTTPLDSAYPSNTIQPLSVDNNVTAYSTASSSTSAMEDAKQFEKDPMWTLLSKMRIIPRLAQLLNNNLEENLLPGEAWLASIGILSMLSQRSPGAASAIVHHNTLLSCILEHALKRYSQESLRQQEEERDVSLVLDQMAFASLQLLVTLSRQSRITAQAIVPHIENVLPPLLLESNANVSHLGIRIQKMAVILWRTLLRYGLGLDGLSTMLNLAARHWALPSSSPHSLSTEFLSAVTQVLECAKVAQSKPPSLTDSNDSPIGAASMSVLSMAATYLTSTRRQLLPLITENDRDDESESLDDYRWNAARLHFLSTFWLIAGTTGEDHNEEIKVEDLSMEEELSCLEALDTWTDPGGKVDAAWAIVCRHLMIDIDEDSHANKMEEAAACTFLVSFASLLLTLEKSGHSEKNRLVSELARAVVTHFTERVLNGLKLALSKGKEDKKKLSLARQGWINQCHFALAKVLFHSITLGILATKSEINEVRMLVFSLLGDLQHGNESIAAVLFSQDVLYSQNALQQSSKIDSPISSLFLGELCGSERARKQVDHSFKLQHGFGITSDGFGPFSLDSLLSEADQGGPRASLIDSVLPLEKIWLWQTLSGFIRIKKGALDTGTAEATHVVSSVLGLILDLEEESDNHEGYSSRIPLGTRLYYLFNVCLHPEDILRNESLMESAEMLLELYIRGIDHSSLYDFSRACFQHTEPSKGEKSSASTDQDKELLEKLLNPDSLGGTLLPPGEMRALEALLEDMMSAYRDYGAQYPFFTKCVRLFLSPVFPSSIQCKALVELRGIHHLLTLPDEIESSEKMSKLLAQTIPSSIVVQDGVSVVPLKVVDTIISLFDQEKESRPLNGFILNYALAMLACNLLFSLSDQMALQSSKKRLQRLANHTMSTVCQIALKLSTDNGSEERLIEATLNVTRDQSKPIADLDECIRQLSSKKSIRN